MQSAFSLGCWWVGEFTLEWSGGLYQPRPTGASWGIQANWRYPKTSVRKGPTSKISSCNSREEDVYTRLSRLNPAKDGGPDGIPNWVLREYAEFLAYPISVILSASFREQRLPSIWKLADVTPLPKQKPVKEIKKDLWPISLTPCISKLAEDFVVTEYVKPAVLCMLDPSKFGVIPKSSTTLALLEMLHKWTQGTDWEWCNYKNSVVWLKKAFDLIDHSILVRKLWALSIPPSIMERAYHSSRWLRRQPEGFIFLSSSKEPEFPRMISVFSTSRVRSVIDYAAPVFHYSLPAYLIQELERIQKGAMWIICPGIEYQYALVLVNLPTVAKHHNDICRRTFESICNDSGSKLKKLLPPLHECKYKLRHTRTFNEPRCRTNRAKNSFIMASCSLLDFIITIRF